MEHRTLRASGAQVGRWLWERYGRRSAQATIRAAVEEFKIRLDSHPFASSTSGLLWPTDAGEYVITTNANQSPERQWFTVAHELGHYFRDVGTRESRELDRDSLVERESDACAAEIMLPLEAASTLYAEIQGDLHAAQLIAAARAHGISQAAIRTRLEVLSEHGWLIRPRELLLDHRTGLFLDQSLQEEHTEITATITGWHVTRRRWRENRRVCLSPDGRLGLGEPGGACQKCPERDGLCRTYTVLYLAQPGERFAASLLLPPSSGARWREFADGHPWLGGQWVRLRLSPQTCAAGTWYGIEPEAVGAPGAITMGLTVPNPAAEPPDIQSGRDDAEYVALRACGASAAACGGLAQYCEAHGGHLAAARLRRRAVTAQSVGAPA